MVTKQQPRSFLPLAMMKESRAGPAVSSFFLVVHFPFLQQGIVLAISPFFLSFVVEGGFSKALSDPPLFFFPPSVKTSVAARKKKNLFSFSPNEVGRGSANNFPRRKA